MPKERRSRTVVHAPPVKIHKRTFAVQENATEHVEIGAATDASGNDILAALEATGAPQDSSTKKEKRALKREVFLQKLGAIKTPYSKSHARREKRKVKEQLAGGELNEIKAILSTIAADEDDTNEAKAGDVGRVARRGDTSSMETDQHEEQNKTSAQRKTMKIGESKAVHLTKNQRKNVLNMEQLRQPLIRSNPEFTKNPFATIRTHAQNTLLKRQAPS